MKNKGLRVLTYNIHKGFNISNQRFILHQIREALIHADADLLFLQEIQGKHDRHEKNIAQWPDQSQIEFIAEGVWPHFAYGKNAIYNAGHHGNAILSKYRFESWENINVSPFPWASRSLLHGVIGTPQGDQDVHIVCIHFGLMGNERRSQIATLCDRIDSHVPHDAPLIVAGDFNDWLGQAGQFFFNRLGLHEVFRETYGCYARTFPSWLPILQMDRIYYRGLIPVSCDRLAHSPWDKLSDHAPLAASFAF
jgi:endonuclease/exonuclease/phosphatase family metal-dependent hydrolase